MPLDGPKARSYYHSSLLALMRADERAARPDVGAIDADPVCACQVWNGIWNVHITIETENARRAVARASFALQAPRNATKEDQRRVVFTLVPENGAWRIWNIRDESQGKPSDVREALQADLKMVKTSHHHSKR